jgi:hypothetical protein
LKVHRYFFNRGSKSRNKVAVGEPAAGSFSDDQKKNKKTPSQIISLEKENGLEKQKHNTQSIVLFCRSSAPVRVFI